MQTEDDRRHASGAAPAVKPRRSRHPARGAQRWPGSGLTPEDGRKRTSRQLRSIPISTCRSGRSGMTPSIAGTSTGCRELRNYANSSRDRSLASRRNGETLGGGRTVSTGAQLLRRAATSPVARRAHLSLVEPHAAGGVALDQARARRPRKRLDCRRGRLAKEPAWQALPGRPRRRRGHRENLASGA